MNNIPHTRSDTIEDALRDDVLALRRTVEQRDREIAALRAEVKQLKAPSQPLCRCLCSCLSRSSTWLAQVCCPCFLRPALGQQLLAEHTQRLHDQRSSARLSGERMQRSERELLEVEGT